jgi:hypothetical protein
MAHCSQCGKDVGCGCNLVEGSGMCISCFSSNLPQSSQPTAFVKKSTKKVVYSNPVSPQPNTEFDIILNNKGLSKEEKIKRINDTLEKARQNYANNS